MLLAAFTLPKVYELKKDEIDRAVDNARKQVRQGPLLGWVLTSPTSLGNRLHQTMVVYPKDLGWLTGV